MKCKISISIDEETLEGIETALANSTFRNKSHFIEYAAQKMLKEGKNDR
jgi:metal-responsive CopG/Arc/MetJ family transcriptional regulator